LLLRLHAGGFKRGCRHAGSGQGSRVFQRGFPAYDVQKVMMAYCLLLAGTLTINARKIIHYFFD